MTGRQFADAALALVGTRCRIDPCSRSGLQAKAAMLARDGHLSASSDMHEVAPWWSRVITGERRCSDLRTARLGDGVPIEEEPLSGALCSEGAQ